MKEKLVDIVKNISDAGKTARSERFPSFISARLHSEINGKTKTYWLCDDSIKNMSMYPYQGLKAFGYFVPRNAGIAVDMLNNTVGQEMPVVDTDEYGRPQKGMLLLENKSDLVNKIITLLGEEKPYEYDGIDSFLAMLVAKQREIEENERLQKEKERELEELKKQENTAHQRGIVTKGLNKLREEKRILLEQQEELNKLTRFIREQGKLRYNPILDPVQNQIKTSHLFDGTTIVIDGGPGTGKTTTMIQRLKYLTDEYAINEDAEQEKKRYHLTTAQRGSLLDAIRQNRDWMFFSPSELLKEYLADAMNKEGLTDTKSKVWNWKEFLKKVTRDYYRFIDPSSDNTPFLASRSHDVLIYQKTDAISAIQDFYLKILRQIKNKLPNIETKEKPYRWESIANGIKQRFEDSDSYNIVQFVRLFSSLEAVYAADCRSLIAENRSLVKNISEELFALTEDDEKLSSALKDLLALTVGEANEDDGDDTESEEDDAANRTVSAIRTWFRRYCYAQIDKEVKLTPRQLKIKELLEPILMDEHKKQITHVGELVLFEQFAKYTRGVTANMLTGMPTKYKQFRRTIYANKVEGWNLELLGSLLQRRGGKELHQQEQALLLGFVNNLVKTILENTSDNNSHYYIDAYRDLARPIIGVDEATDFCECDIYAMTSFLTTGYSSLTLCGDIMQRLTKSGITSWDEIDNIVPNKKELKMITSYRQSTRLLEVAKALYRDTLKREPEYKAYMKSKKVPAPLSYVSGEELDKIEWIGQRIGEVYNIYKQLPSIAIFLNNEDSIPAFVKALKETDFIYDTDIEVVDGSSGIVLASSNQIRVYPIKVVKGMEFDVVFFHNIDLSAETDETIKRYIYVGVSRAAFFLAATFSKLEGNEEILKYFDTSKKDWKTI